jgi:hypothetical protein
MCSGDVRARAVDAPPRGVTPTTDGWEEVEQRSLLESRWWSVKDLLTTDDTVYPNELAQVLRAVLDETVEQPIRLSDR